MRLTNDLTNSEDVPTDLDMDRGTITDGCEFYNPISDLGGSCRLNQAYISEESCSDKNNCSVYIRRMGELSS